MTEPISVYLFDPASRSADRHVEVRRWTVGAHAVVRLVNARTGRPPVAPFFELRGRTRHRTLAAARRAIEGA